MRCHSYIFFDSAPSINGIDEDKLRFAKKVFAETLIKYPNVQTESFATIGFKAGNRFMVHLQAEEAAAIQGLVRALMHTSLGAHLNIVYTLCGLIRPSQYAPPHAEEKPEKERQTTPERRYLIIYPFTKTIEWHLLPFDERRAMMKEHVGIGRTFSDSIEQLLLYGYGVDDHEFIVSYETDDLFAFQKLVMELRATKGRAYTLSDTPLHLCTRATIQEALETI